MDHLRYPKSKTCASKSLKLPYLPRQREGILLFNKTTRLIIKSVFQIFLEALISKMQIIGLH